MTINEMKIKRDEYLTKFRSTVFASMEYLHEHCDEWTPNHKEAWEKMVHEAEIMLTKAQAIHDLIKAEEKVS